MAYGFDRLEGNGIFSKTVLVELTLWIRSIQMYFTTRLVLLDLARPKTLSRARLTAFSLFSSFDLKHSVCDITAAMTGCKWSLQHLKVTGLILDPCITQIGVSLNKMLNPKIGPKAVQDV